MMTKRESVTCYTFSEEETIQMGMKLGALLKQGDVIALVGELGSGKTWFAKGLALGLGVSSDTVITSPSFSLVNEYEGRHPFFHLDAYRLESRSDFLSAGLEEYLYQDGVAAMEWAYRWPEILPDQHVKIDFEILDFGSRKITLSGRHARALEILDHMECEAG